jgi:LmbE family N-acetylglucosaminyl deacetylase
VPYAQHMPAGSMPSAAASTRRHHLFLAPHPDDAVWACGGLIDALVGHAHRVTVLTIFDGPSASDTRDTRDAWRAVADAARRSAENRVALALLGAHAASAGIVDAALRSVADRFVYSTQRAIRRRVHDADAGIVDLIAAAVAGQDPDVVYAPLGIGGHVDHVLSHQAATRLESEVLWYEDFPYRSREPLDGESFVEPVELTRWIEAAACYESQVGVFFRSTTDLAAAIERRAAENAARTIHRYAQRLWVTCRTYS